MRFTLALLLLSAATSAIAKSIPRQIGADKRNTVQASVSSTSTTDASAASASIACNNAYNLCDVKYNAVTHMGAHDSSFLRDAATSYSVAGTQFYNASWALDAGIRLLQIQVHENNGTLHMCHTSCSILDAGTLESYLVDIKSWMDANPDDVVTLLIVNSDDKDAATFGSVFEASGISKYGYTPASTSATTDWPTLRTMISANTRLVTFIAALDYDATYPYLLDEWTYMFETAYQVTSASGFNCTINRPSGIATAAAAISSGMMPLVNHFMYKQYTLLSNVIDVPNPEDVDETNSPNTNTTGALGTHAQQCKSEYGQQPVFFLVDFWNRGPSMATADALNNVTDPVGRTHTDLTTSGSATSSSSSAAERNGAGSMFALGVGVVAALLMGF
ncbi:hypothetical protein TD95_001779 [Thielaviopsis punctulata]|uniref:Phosphatidylinositol-specific phospholipase C X domain-containing protein n=1 Tax=Thielaviopsis punctulata TaxID=72032 RepID=A0A0F4ZKM7_9PEZI|nr:hypothetical protein TD95_001779 [Thielaviopsis punctulata]